ncbi:hypothetical protein GCM10022230_00530 [Pseudoclavibacter caeni]
MTSFAVMAYNTTNIGDDVQSVAAEAYLPEGTGKTYVYRDEIANDGGWSSDMDKIKLIGNAWYGGKRFSWPPAQQYDFLPIAMHIEYGNSIVRKRFEKEQSLKYVKGIGALGARDLSTLKYLRSLGLNAYFSGCLTLTLQRISTLRKQPFGVTVDVDKDVANAISQSASKDVIRLSANVPAMKNTQRRMRIARTLLGIYQSASFVVTSRIHVMLPCLALGTPVVFVPRGNMFEPKRLEGLTDLSHTYISAQTFLGDIHSGKLNLDKFTNPVQHIKLRNDLIERVRGFTGNQPRPYADVNDFLIDIYDRREIADYFNRIESTFMITNSWNTFKYKVKHRLRHHAE